MNLTLNNFPDGLTASYHVPPPPLLYNTPRHFLLFVSFTLLIYHLSTARANFLFSRSLVDSSSFLRKKGNKKKISEKKICPYFPSVQVSNRLATGLPRYLSFSAFNDMKGQRERERKRNYNTFFFFFLERSK